MQAVDDSTLLEKGPRRNHGVEWTGEGSDKRRTILGRDLTPMFFSSLVTLAALFSLLRVLGEKPDWTRLMDDGIILGKGRRTVVEWSGLEKEDRTPILLFLIW